MRGSSDSVRGSSYFLPRIVHHTMKITSASTAPASR